MLSQLQSVLIENSTNYAFTYQANAYFQLDDKRNKLTSRRNSTRLDGADVYTAHPRMPKSLKERGKLMPEGKVKKKKKCDKKKIGGGRKKLRKSKQGKKYKKLLMPMIVGLLTAKSVIVPFILKGLAMLSTKGIILGFISIMMASFLTLKSLLQPAKIYDRRDDQKTNIEVVPGPATIQTEHRYYEPQIYHEKKNSLVVHS